LECARFGDHRDFRSELELQILEANPAFQVQDLSFCTDVWKHMQPPAEDIDASQQSHSEDTIEAKSACADAYAFDADKSKVSHDISKWATYEALVAKQTQKAHVLKVLHLRAQNDLGAKIVDGFMRKDSLHILGNIESADAHFDEATECGGSLWWGGALLWWEGSLVVAGEQPCARASSSTRASAT
jgi:hypothetical protein